MHSMHSCVCVYIHVCVYTEARGQYQVCFPRSCPLLSKTGSLSHQHWPGARSICLGQSPLPPHWDIKYTPPLEIEFGPGAWAAGKIPPEPSLPPYTSFLFILLTPLFPCMLLSTDSSAKPHPIRPACSSSLHFTKNPRLY